MRLLDEAFLRQVLQRQQSLRLRSSSSSFADDYRVLSANLGRTFQPSTALGDGATLVALSRGLGTNLDNANNGAVPKANRRFPLIIGTLCSRFLRGLSLDVLPRTVEVLAFVPKQASLP